MRVQVSPSAPLNKTQLKLGFLLLLNLNYPNNASAAVGACFARANTELEAWLKICDLVSAVVSFAKSVSLIRLLDALTFSLMLSNLLIAWRINSGTHLALHDEYQHI